MKRLEVHKFGGTSVADAAHLKAAAGLIAERLDKTNIVVVSSATSGTTDQLIDIGTSAASGAMDRMRAAVAALLDRHLRILNDLAPEGDAETEREIRDLVNIVQRLAEAVGIHGELTGRVHDRIVATGEKIAVRLFALALRRTGASSVPCDADRFVHTDANFKEANVLTEKADPATRDALFPLLERGVVPVVTGFTGCAPDGATTTLGRGGSDYSATLLAASLDADEVTIWTDVDGVMTANPKIVPEARVLATLNYREAAEMSFYGAKVLHQRTMIPVAGRKIPVRTRNTENPSHPGTVVDSSFAPGSCPVKAVSAISGHALISIEGKGMAGVTGFSAKLFRVIASRNISVTMYTQSSSEASICLALPEKLAEQAKEALDEAFEKEMKRGEVEGISVVKGVGLIAIVGLGMARTPGVAGKATLALGENKINILAMAQGSSELNITLAVSASEVDRGVRVLHDAFGLHRIDTGVATPDGLDIILLGAGKVGRALSEIVSGRHEHIRQRFGLDARVVAVADSTGYLLEPRGFSAEQLSEIIGQKSQGARMADQPGGVRGSGCDVVESALAYRLNRPVLVDTSNAENVADVYKKALRRGCDVVTANKHPLAGSMATYSALFAAAREQGRILKAGATVGAGLPVIDTLEMLLGSGDRLNTVLGALSGTLGHIMGRLDEGARFSEALAEAVESGYTESDPAVDLTGLDSVRKAIILGRLSGLTGHGASVEVRGVVDDSWFGMKTGALISRSQELDASMAEKVAAAKAEGNALRYLARIEREHVVVEMMARPADSPSGRLSGPKNLVLFRSDRYDKVPLVFTGPGAGVEVAAMGVFGDILRVAAERGR